MLENARKTNSFNISQCVYLPIRNLHLVSHFHYQFLSPTIKLRLHYEGNTEIFHKLFSLYLCLILVKNHSSLSCLPVYISKILSRIHISQIYLYCNSSSNLRYDAMTHREILKCFHSPITSPQWSLSSFDLVISQAMTQYISHAVLLQTFLFPALVAFLIGEFSTIVAPSRAVSYIAPGTSVTFPLLSLHHLPLLLLHLHPLPMSPGNGYDPDLQNKVQFPGCKLYTTSHRTDVTKENVNSRKHILQLPLSLANYKCEMPDIVKPVSYTFQKNVYLLIDMCECGTNTS